MSAGEWIAVRSAIKEQEQHIQTTYGLPVQVYGSGSQGYELLASCLNRGEYRIGGDTVPASHIWTNSGQRSHTLRKQVHEYWTFLTVTECLLDGHRYEGDRGVTYQPTQGDRRQSPTLPTPDGTVFVEPCLTGYDESPILNRWNQRLDYLTEKDTRNVRPDLLIAEPGVEEIPWGVWLFHSGGLADEKQHEAQWQAFRDNVRWIIECKHTTPHPRDLSQTLWYALAYEAPVALLLQEQVNPEVKQPFETDAAQLNTTVRLVDGYETGDRAVCASFISDILS